MNFFRPIFFVLGAVLMCGCAQSPTPYRPIIEGQVHTGYATEKLEDGLYRVDFLGTPNTSERTARAFALFRAAELAQELSMAAFTVVKGPVDRSLLEGEDFFSLGDRPVSVGVASDTTPMRDDVDRTIGGAATWNALNVRKVKGATTIWVPIYVPDPSSQPQSKLVILRLRMHATVPADDDPRTFLTSEVLARLGPRITRGQRS
jgi:hypothetical protein